MQNFGQCPNVAPVQWGITAWKLLVIWTFHVTTFEL